MTIFSLYIFDRHCDCIYYQDWHRTRPIRPPSIPNFRPGVHRLPPPLDPLAAQSTVRESIFDRDHAVSNVITTNGARVLSGSTPATNRGYTGLPFDEETKLVYGVVLSMRNMVKKLSGRDETFTSYRTNTYKLHLYETLTGYRFVLLSDPSTDSLRFVLRQIYVGPFVDYVVRNPMVQLDSRTEGIDNDHFRAAVDAHMRGLSMFGT
ncbi:Sybindin-like protein [Naematelia encephala]|uniref:Trafficking protein particle complex subunit n=1 Tax=Naematelia encephala TaxID=71784 RepID=A0A1Y2B3W0_9TREE|nr:Sybindin-like protein [Naematelia encephala]